mmetsp:Transcript_10443/g.19037  ORF Transcript_10443/g.19037 Transcript_10443/m.19037 type:complete len:123 (-) Transcript_10443:213-581(-)
MVTVILAQLARDVNSLGVGLAFAVITSLALTALFSSIAVLEDPFVATLTLDGIDVNEELTVLYYHQLVDSRSLFFPPSQDTTTMEPFILCPSVLLPTVSPETSQKDEDDRISSYADPSRPVS